MLGRGGELRLHGEKQLLADLAKMEKGAAGRAVGRAQAAGSKFILDELDDDAPEVTGATEKALGRKKLRPKRGERMTMIGVRNKVFKLRKTKRGTFRNVGKKGRAKAKAEGQKLIEKRPGFYAHHVEKKNPWMAPGFKRLIGPVLALIGRVLRFEIETGAQKKR